MKIRPRKSPSGRISFQLDLGLVNGRRIRKNFQYKADAQAALVAARAQALSQGVTSLAPKEPEHPSLPKWLAKLHGTGKTLDDVFEWFFSTYREKPSAPPLPSLITAYGEELERLNRTRQHTRESVSILQSVFASFPQLSDVTRTGLLPFITQNGYSPRTQRKRLVISKAFLAWCVGCGHLDSNPLSGSGARIRIPKAETSEILCLGIPEVRRLLHTASQPENRILLGWIALALFAGVRPQEIARSPRNSLSIPGGTFRVTARASKTAQTRVIELHPTAIAWLQFWEATAAPDTPFKIRGHRERWDRIREKAGLAQNWVHDVLRHSFASMHYAAFQNASQLRAIMGHSQNENTLFAHYRAVQTVQGVTLSKSMAEDFWNLTPRTLHARR
jgi:integrase